MPQITIKAARVNAGLTIAAVAKELGVAVSTVKNWESGKSYPKPPQIDRLCELYKISYDYIRFTK
jgi:transcriptional regulator with XRE-family HTH domain